jgi:hypothetical protein
LEFEIYLYRLSTHIRKPYKNGKFCLIHVIFSDELSNEVMRSEESATHDDLHAGLVGYKSYFGA